MFLFTAWFKFMLHILVILGLRGQFSKSSHLEFSFSCKFFIWDIILQKDTKYQFLRPLFMLVKLEIYCQTEILSFF